MKNLRTPEMTKKCDISKFQAFPIPDLQKVGFVEYHFFFLALRAPQVEESWVTVAIARTTMLSDIYLGYPKFMTHLCQHIMSEVEDGFTVDFDGTPVLLTIGSITIVADARWHQTTDRLQGCCSSEAMLALHQCSDE